MAYSVTRPLDACRGMDLITNYSMSFIKNYLMYMLT